MPVKLTIWKLILAGVALICVAVVMVLARRRLPQTVRRAVPRLTCRPVRVRELIPSGGLDWSRDQYPEQHDAENRRETTLRPVEGVATDEFRQRQRFLDVAGRAFSRHFNSRFSYEPAEWSPEVRVSWLRRAETFVGRLEATGLKPNFAYQLKLRGVFEDREAFERIGRLGRWRLPGFGTNFTDADYETYPDKSEVRSYLFFDFFVTDAEGNASKEFYLDSTLHVLYNATWQGRPRTTDTRPIMVRPGRPDSELYARPVPRVEPQEIYAESEERSPSGNSRPPVGEAFLPPGTYRAELVLTEESFHGFGDAGYWATVMRAPVEFEITDRPHPPAGPWKSLEPIRNLSLAEARAYDIDAAGRDQAHLRGEATDDGAGLIFEETLDLPAGERYVLRMDLEVEDPQTAQVIVDSGDGFDLGPHYYADSRGCERWRRFEVEITHAVGGNRARIWLAPRLDAGPVGVRNVSVCGVEQ